MYDPCLKWFCSLLKNIQVILVKQCANGSSSKHLGKIIVPLPNVIDFWVKIKCEWQNKGGYQWFDGYEKLTQSIFCQIFKHLRMKSRKGKLKNRAVICRSSRLTQQMSPIRFCTQFLIVFWRNITIQKDK